MSQDTRDGDESRSPRRESIDLTAISAPYTVLGYLSDPNDAIGVLGRNTATSGVTRGVEGRVDSPAGYGLYTPDRAKIGGTLAVSTLGTFDSSGLELVVDSENALRLQPVSDPGGGPNVLAGHPTNTIVSGVAQATIAGGGFNDGTTGGTQPNEIYDDGCTIGGGRGNVAGRDDGNTSSSEGMNATVSGGKGNTAKGQQSTIGGGGAHVANSFAATIAGGNACRSTADGAAVGGGLENHATGNSATVGGGVNNRATGKAATIAGGNANTASGTNSFATGINNTADGGYSVAMGREEDANGKDGAFFRGDATLTAVTATATNSMVVQAGGEVRPRGPLTKSTPRATEARGSSSTGPRVRGVPSRQERPKLTSNPSTARQSSTASVTSKLAPGDTTDRPRTSGTWARWPKTSPTRSAWAQLTSTLRMWTPTGWHWQPSRVWPDASKKRPRICVPESRRGTNGSPNSKPKPRSCGPRTTCRRRVLTS